MGADSMLAGSFSFRLLPFNGNMCGKSGTGPFLLFKSANGRKAVGSFFNDFLDLTRQAGGRRKLGGT